MMLSISARRETALIVAKGTQEVLCSKAMELLLVSFLGDTVVLIRGFQESMLG